MLNRGMFSLEIRGRRKKKKLLKMLEVAFCMGFTEIAHSICERKDQSCSGGGTVVKVSVLGCVTS